MSHYYRQARDLMSQLTDLLDALHRRPELSFQEYETTRFLVGQVQALGLERIDLGMDTGLVAWMPGRRTDRVVAIRADIDAIAVRETDSHRVRSENEGVMHACGHDFHMTCALGAAMLLGRIRDRLPFGVVFIFQPAEEITRGAAAMVRKGLADRLPGQPAAFFALHAEPRLMTGRILSSRDYASASKTNFRIRLEGTTGHSGAPQTYRDVVVAAASMVTAIQTIVSRDADPLRELVCAVHTIKAGGEDFFVTDRAELTGTIRAFDQELVDMAEDRLEAIVSDLASLYGCRGSLELIPEVGAQINHPDLSELTLQACHRVFGATNTLVRGPLFMGAEDFSVFGDLAPSHLYWIGTSAPGQAAALHHEPDFRVDPGAIPYGVAILVESVVGLAASGGPGLEGE